MSTKLIPALEWMLRIIKALGGLRARPNIFSYITMVSLALVNLLLVTDLAVSWTGIESLRKITFFPGFFITAIKAIFLIYNSSRLIKIIDSLRHFWRPDDFAPDVAQKYRRTFKVTGLICAGYACSGYVICLMMVARGILGFPQRTLVYSDYALCNLQSVPCWITMLIWQSVALLVQIVPVAIGFDVIFITFVVYVVTGYELLNVQLQNLSTADVTSRKVLVKNIVLQHNFILEFVKELNELFSVVMLVQFSCSLWSMILVPNVMIANGIPPKMADVAFLGPLYAVVTFQIFLYASGGSILEERVKKLSTDMYWVNWYDEGRTDLRKDLSLMILRANKTQILSAGKMSDLNLALFMGTVKNSLSVLALLVQLYE